MLETAKAKFDIGDARPEAELSRQDTHREIARSREKRR